MEELKNKTKSLVGLNIASILRNLFGLLRAKLVTLLFGTQGVGVLGQILTFFGLQNRLTVFGLDAFLINRIGQEKGEHAADKTKSFIITALFVLFFINFIYLGFLLYFIDTLTFWIFKNSAYKELLFILILSGPFFAFFYFLEVISQATLQFKKLVIGRLYGSLSGILIGLPLIYMFGYKGIIYSLQVMVLGAGIYFLLYNYHYISFKHFRIKKAFKNLPFLFKISFTDFSRKTAMFVGLLTFRILIVQKLSMQQNGLFQSIWAISLYLDIFWSAFVSYYFPSIAHAQNRENSKKVIQNNLNIILLIYFPISAVLMIAPDLTLYLLFSRDFLTVASYLSMLVLIRFLELYYKIYSVTFLAHAHLKIFLGAEVLRYLVLVTSTYFFIDYFGFSGLLLSIFLMVVVSIVTVVVYNYNKPNYALALKEHKQILMYLFLLSILLIPDFTGVSFRILKILLFGGLSYKLLDWHQYHQALQSLFNK